MFSWLYNNLIYNPLYNLLVLLIDIPFFDAGMAVVGITVIIRLIFIPLSKKVEYSQIKIRELQPQFDLIKEKHKDNREMQAMEMLRIYKENKINPFAGILLLIIQLPILITLYYIFFSGGLPSIKTDILYGFIAIPQNVNTMFLGIIDIAKNNNFVLAVVAAAAQYIQVQTLMPKTNNLKKVGESFKDDLARSMTFQAKFVMPVFTFFITYTLPSVIALYWITTSIFSIAQTYFVKKSMPKTEVVLN